MRKQEAIVVRVLDATALKSVPNLLIRFVKLSTSTIISLIRKILALGKNRSAWNRANLFRFVMNSITVLMRNECSSVLTMYNLEVSK